MSRQLVLFFATLALSGSAQAQEVYGPPDTTGSTESDEPVPLVEAKPCEETIREDGAIVVCRELDEAERYLSPLPRPVEVHIDEMDGLREPPCWVTGKKPCIRFGSVPEYPPMIDVSAFPEPLSEEEAAAVIALPANDEDERRAAVGTRVAIDLSEEE